MATQPDDDEPLELTEELEPDEESEEQRDEEENPETNDDDDGETIVAFEGEEDEKPDDNSVIRQMRQELRETKRKLQEVERANTQPKKELRPEPDFDRDGEKYDWDHEKWKEDWKAWQAEKVDHDKQSETQAEQSRKANEAWQADLGAFEQKKAALQFDDRDDVIETATTSLDMVQQAVVVKAAADPALFLYALGKSEAKRAELAKIQDPIKLAAAVARMEGAVKVTKGRKAPEPDRPLSGTAKMPGGADKELEKLEKEAERTGDRTKIIAHKKRIADAAKK